MTRELRYRNDGGSRLLLLCDFFLIGTSFYAATRIDLDVEPTLYFLYEGGLVRAVFATLTILAAMYFHHLYNDVRVRSRVLLFQQLCEVFGLTLLAQSLVAYAAPDWILPRWLMVYGALFSLAAIFFWRMLYSHFVLNIVRRHRIVFVGRNQTVREIAREVANAPGWGYEVMGYVDGQDAQDEGPVGKYLGPYGAFASLARKLRPDRIVVGLEDRTEGVPVKDLLQLHYEGLSIEEARTTYESINHRVCIRDLDEDDLVFSGDFTPAANAVALQRALDRIAALALMMICLPVMSVFALALRLDSWEPCLARTRRAGYNGKPFHLLRFRTSPKLSWLYGRLHLDALPELFNVLRGEMSLVGPKPESPEAAAERSRDFPLYDYRLNVPPGMTGWAQINLTKEEYEADPLNVLEYDLYYIKHISQALKTYILMTTFKNRVIWGDQRS